MKESGKTQKDVAAAAGVSQPAVSGWLKGALPGIEEVVRLAEFFNCEISQLIGPESAKGILSHSFQEAVDRIPTGVDGIIEAEGGRVVVQIKWDPLRTELSEIRESAIELLRKIETFERRFEPAEKKGKVSSASPSGDVARERALGSASAALRHVHKSGKQQGTGGTSGGKSGPAGGSGGS